MINKLQKEIEKLKKQESKYNKSIDTLETRLKNEKNNLNEIIKNRLSKEYEIFALEIKNSGLSFDDVLKMIRNKQFLELYKEDMKEKTEVLDDFIE